MNRLPLNVWLLTISQALVMSVASLNVFIGGLVGTKLAPIANLATLPVASITVGTAALIIPVTMLMKRLGRRNAFSVILFFSALNSVFAGYAISIESFYLFCFSVFLFGATTACVAQFRFAAIESVASDLIPNAASAVLLGGIAAAFIGPEIGLLGKDLLSVEYAGSFHLLAGLFILALIILRLFKNSKIEEMGVNESSRPLKDIASQPLFWIAVFSASIGYAVMSFIMTATPVSMHVMDGHSLQDTKWVIQSHIVAMFLPSLISAWTIKKLGVSKMMITGLIAYLFCVAIAFSGHSFINYWLSLILLGVGWNFLYIGGTTLLPRSYNPSERFKVQAANDFFIFGTQAIASLSAGWFVFAIGWEMMLMLNFPFIFFLAFVILRWGSHTK